MSKSNFIAGLDIGTNNIKLLVIEQKDGAGRPEIAAQMQSPSIGVRKGVVIDEDKVSQTIEELLEKFKVENGKRIDSLYTNIAGSHLFSIFSRGTVAVSRADRKISEEDIDRVIQAARTISLPSNKEILNIFPKEFIVDGQAGIKEAVGLNGVRLEAEAMVLAGFAPYIQNLTKAVLGAGVHNILDIIPSSLAGAAAVASQKQKEIGVCVVDIGAGTTDLAIFEEGSVVHLASLPIGSANITNDIAIYFKTDIDVAERIKIEMGSCLYQGSDKKEKIDGGQDGSLIFSRKALNKIINLRMAQIFREVHKEIKTAGKHNVLPAGIILTGGGSKLPKIVDLAKKEFKLPCRLGKMENFSGMEDDPAFSTACGLVMSSLNFGESQAKNYRQIGDIKEKLSKLFRIFIP